MLTDLDFFQTEMDNFKEELGDETLMDRRHQTG
jgi:hypothetical protein